MLMASTKLFLTNLSQRNILSFVRKECNAILGEYKGESKSIKDFEEIYNKTKEKCLCK